MGDGATVIPVSAILYVGYDAQVSAVNSASSYIGVPVAAGISYSLVDYRGVVDSTTIWLFSVNDQSIDIIWQGL